MKDFRGLDIPHVWCLETKTQNPAGKERTLTVDSTPARNASELWVLKKEKGPRPAPAKRIELSGGVQRESKHVPNLKGGTPLPSNSTKRN